MKIERGYPIYTVTPKAENAIVKGHPWVYDAEILNTEGEVLHVLHHRYTYLPEASHLLFLLIRVLYHCGYLRNAGSTMKIQPTVALCLSLSLHQLRTEGTCSLPTHRLQQAVIHQFLSAHRILPLADEVEVLLPVPEHFHTSDSE